MTSGPIVRQLVAFALPLMLGNVFQMLYNTVDSIIVGNFVSKQALAAIGSTTMIVNMLVFFFNGFSTGAVVTIGQFYGAQKMEKLHKAVETTIAATFLLSLLFTIGGVLSVKPLLRMMSTPEDVFEDATVYLRIYIGGISGLLIYNIGSGILRAVGDSTRPLYFLILTSLVNIVLDLLFVVVLGTGIAGAAIATILSQFLSAALILLMLTRTKDIYRLDWKELQMDGQILGKIFAIGMPAGIQSVLTAFSNIFVQSYINSFGSDCMAGWSSYNKLDQFIMLPMQSMAIASTTFVSQNVGADNDQRADRGTVASLMLTCGITGVIIALLVRLTGTHDHHAVHFCRPAADLPLCHDPLYCQHPANGRPGIPGGMGELLRNRTDLLCRLPAKAGTESNSERIALTAAERPGQCVFAFSG